MKTCSNAEELLVPPPRLNKPIQMVRKYSLKTATSALARPLETRKDCACFMTLVARMASRKALSSAVSAGVTTSGLAQLIS